MWVSKFTGLKPISKALSRFTLLHSLNQFFTFAFHSYAVCRYKSIFRKGYACLGLVAQQIERVNVPK
jgi:hypothetical protein